MPPIEMAGRGLAVIGVGTGGGQGVFQEAVKNGGCPWGLAERQGFEPWVRFHVHTLSKRAP